MNLLLLELVVVVGVLLSRVLPPLLLLPVCTSRFEAPVAAAVLDALRASSSDARGEEVANREALLCVSYSPLVLQCSIACALECKASKGACAGRRLCSGGGDRRG